ncbi:MAG: hypothetical protein XXXJIFNMEKO3_02991 [Candidatus Erwinia impunctatus]|nr:hypothetical protein XXXJIFNMEKO_02991 [Culicoides impunctatus]
MVLVNFLPWRAKLLRQRIQCDRLLWASALIAVLAGSIDLIARHQAIQLQRSLLSAWQQAHQHIDSILQQRIELQKQIERYQRETDRLHQRQQRLAYLLDFIAGLGKTLPAVWLNTLTMTPQKITIQGNGRQVDELVQWKQSLQRFEGLQQVQLMKVVQEMPGILHFILSATPVTHTAKER